MLYVVTTLHEPPGSVWALGFRAIAMVERTEFHKSVGYARNSSSSSRHSSSGSTRKRSTSSR